MISSKDEPLTRKTDLLINSWHFVLLQKIKAISDNSEMIFSAYKAKYHIDLCTKLFVNSSF